MTVAKVIRFLGYIVYTALWLPVIVLAMFILPFVYMFMCRSIIRGLTLYWYAFVSGIRHDVEFIRTGIWW